MKTTEGKVALVTGGSAGLGADAALQFEREGAKVVVAARRRDQSEAMLRQIEALGGEGLFVQTDVTRGADIEARGRVCLPHRRRARCASHRRGAGVRAPALAAHLRAPRLVAGR